MSARTQQFVAVYRAARLENQRGYYLGKAEESERARRQLLLTSSLVFGLSAAIGLIAGLDVPGKLVWAIIAAVLPAITTALAAYEGLYAFGRIAKLYADAARNLLLIEPPKLSEPADESAVVAAYVAQVEDIFKRERGQWGQLAAGVGGEREGK